MRPGPVVRPCSPSCPKSCSSKRCDATSRCSRGNKPGGWPASATRKSEKPWPCCIASRPILGRLPSLANEVGISRSVLAERFRRYLSETPIAYLTRWRLQLGAQMLKSTSSSVAQIAAEVGYESEPSFNRAFKREFGLPPARFRTRSRVVRRKGISRALAKVNAVRRHAAVLKVGKRSPG